MDPTILASMLYLISVVIVFPIVVGGDKCLLKRKSALWAPSNPESLSNHFLFLANLKAKQ